MGKIPFRIYRLKRSGNNEKVGFEKLASSWYLEDISENDIIYSDKSWIEGKVRIYPSSIPEYSGSTFQYMDKTVHGPNKYGLYIKMDSKKYYIKGTEEKTNEEDNAAVPNVFEFYLDPQHITPTYRKLQTEIRTRGGWEIQHWGDALTEVRVEGKSGGLHKFTHGTILGKEDDVTTSIAWQRLNQLKALYDSDHRVKNQKDTILLGMNYYDKYFIGYFTDFTGPIASSENPYIVDFSFTFKVQEELSTTLAVNNNLII
jgi:hypothetical protein